MNRFVLFLPFLLSLSCDTWHQTASENQRKSRLTYSPCSEGNVACITGTQLYGGPPVHPTKEMLSCVEYVYRPLCRKSYTDLINTMDMLSTDAASAGAVGLVRLFCGE